MKLIIECEKEYYEMLKYNVEHGQDYKPFEIIANGIPYENKGDLIRREWLEDAFDNLCCHNCKICRNFRNEDSFYKCALLERAPTVEPEITEKQAITTIINSGWLVKHDKELRDRWERPQGER